MVTKMLLLWRMYILEEYIKETGESPFQEWFDGLDAQGAARITIALSRIERGLLTDVKGVGSGVQEYRIHTKPPYRLYFGRDGEQLIILLIGGTKKKQQQDIEQAQDYWKDYKARKKAEQK